MKITGRARANWVVRILLLVGGMAIITVCSRDHVKLQRLWSAEVPADGPLVGMFVPDTEDLLVWTQGQLFRIGAGHDVVEIHVPGEGPIKAVREDTAGFLEVISDGMLHRRGPNGWSARRVLRNSHGSVAQASYTGACKWLIGSPSGDSIVYSYWDGGAVWDRVAEFPEPVRMNQGSSSTILSDATGRTFDIWIVDCQDGVSTLVPTHSTALPEPPPDGKWWSVGVVEITSGYLQTVADLRSDWRMLIYYDHRGRYVRRSFLEAPLGFVGSTARGELVAFADFGEPTVLVYSVAN